MTKHQFAMRVGNLVLLIGSFVSIVGAILSGQWFLGLSDKGAVGVLLCAVAFVFLGSAAGVAEMIWFYRVPPHDPFKNNKLPLQVTLIGAALCFCGGLVFWVISGDALPMPLEGLALMMSGVFLLGCGAMFSGIGGKLQKDAEESIQ